MRGRSLTVEVKVDIFRYDLNLSSANERGDRIYACTVNVNEQFVVFLLSKVCSITMLI